ncbi:MAG: hypothetical protein RKP73_14580 [Candidatus Contendobacter sp.]|nr:hypothetical protein [Candidatus Contendobacter sp.]
MAIPKRGVRDIRTHAGKAASKNFIPYRAYMQITCLEMERTRRDQERASASHRIANIDARLSEIDQAKTTLLRALAERESVNQSLSAGRPAAIMRTGGDGPSGRGGGFRLKY